MVGADETMELWRPPSTTAKGDKKLNAPRLTSDVFLICPTFLYLNLPLYYNQCNQIVRFIGLWASF